MLLGSLQHLSTRVTTCVLAAAMTWWRYSNISACIWCNDIRVMSLPLTTAHHWSNAADKISSQSALLKFLAVTLTLWQQHASSHATDTTVLGIPIITSGARNTYKVEMLLRESTPMREWQYLTFKQCNKMMSLMSEWCHHVIVGIEAEKSMDCMCSVSYTHLTLPTNREV